MSAPLPSAGGAIVKFLLRNSTRHDRPRTPLRLLMHARELTVSLKLFRQYVSAELMFMLLSTARATVNHVSCGLKKAVGLTCPYLKDCNSATKCYNDLIFGQVTQKRCGYTTVPKLLGTSAYEQFYRQNKITY